jgi:hypothetical protein
MGILHFGQITSAVPAAASFSAETISSAILPSEDSETASPEGRPIHQGIFSNH